MPVACKLRCHGLLLLPWQCWPLHRSFTLPTLQRKSFPEKGDCLYKGSSNSKVQWPLLVIKGCASKEGTNVSFAWDIQTILFLCFACYTRQWFSWLWILLDSLVLISHSSWPCFLVTSCHIPTFVVWILKAWCWIQVVLTRKVWLTS